MLNHIARNHYVTFLFWVLVTVLGWLGGILHLDTTARTYLDLTRLLPLYVAEGALIAAVVGIGQALVLKPIIPQVWRWFWATLWGYAFAFPIGLIVMMLIPSIAFRLQGESFIPLSGPSTWSVYLYPYSLFWGGFTIGILQWRILKSITPDPNNKKAALWILACWLGCGLGILIGRWVWSNQSASLERATTGLVVGMITGAVFLILIKQPDAR